MPAGPDLFHECAARERGFRCVAGVDEAGRGALCGPVLAAAVRLDPRHIPLGLNDSKVLTARARETLFAKILDSADVGVGSASVEEIEHLNILRASQLAMLRAVLALGSPPDLALIDGNLVPAGLPCAAQPIVRGDALSLSIAAASIIAKVTRDRIMVDLAQQHPGYGWDRNAGYPTLQHQIALRERGVTPHHRRHFKPVHNILYQEKSVTP